jgi:protein-S-isoprenylcysteine O-methyltransferase Ste14
MHFTAHKLIALIVLPLAAITGIGSLACFVLFLYSGPFNWVKLELSEVQGLLLNTLLSLFFFIQHSGMVRRGFRRLLDNLIPLHYQATTYTIASGVVLFVFLALWQGSDTVLLDIQGIPELIMRSFFFLAVLGTIWGIWSLRFVDLFGLDAVIRHQQVESSVAKPFTIRGPYRWVRHPLYLFTIVFFWSYPVITTDRLLFNTIWTIWVIVGTRLEERELVEDFGDNYRNYQSKVPMLLPRSIRPLCCD